MLDHTQFRIVLGDAMIATIVAGLVVRRRAGGCVCFVTWLAVLAVTDVLIAFWPKRFFHMYFYILKESVLHVLTLGMAFELALWTFRPFPRAYRAARAFAALVVLGLVVLVWPALPHTANQVNVVSRLFPALLEASVWLFTVLGLVSLWYHLPMDAFHKAILVGYTPYLLFSSLVHRALPVFTWDRGFGYMLNMVIWPYTYLTLLAYWTWMVWRRTAEDDACTRVARLVGEPAR